jgi:uncharacterized protein (DUF924 family)
MTNIPHHQVVLDFWFKEIDSKYWWIKDSEFDQLLATRFSLIHAKAAAGELASWRENAEGSLAEVVVLDQFSRNMFRDTPKAFAFDGMALTMAQTAIDKGFDKTLNAVQRSFLYLPFMHSESLYIHEQAVKLFSAPELENNLEFELKHKVIIEKFGRYPHRNEILGRDSTSEELTFLGQPDSSF